MAIISQNAVKTSFYVISGRNREEIESEFYCKLCKTNPICQRAKLMQSVYLQRNMKKNAAKDYEKKAQTNPIKPNFKRPQTHQNKLRAATNGMKISVNVL